MPAKINSIGYQMSADEKAARQSLDDLNQLKVSIWRTDIADYVVLIDQFAGTELAGGSFSHRFGYLPFNPDHLPKIRSITAGLKTFHNVVTGLIAYSTAPFEVIDEIAGNPAVIPDIIDACGRIRDAIVHFQPVFHAKLTALEAALTEAPHHQLPLLWRLWDGLCFRQRKSKYAFPLGGPAQQRMVWQAYECATFMMGLLDMAVLRKDGSVNPECGGVLSLATAPPMPVS